MLLKDSKPIRGMTLLETLSVVACILVLVGLTLPALARGRTSGRATQCLSGTRQVGVAIALYADDHEDWLPPNPDSGEQIDGGQWVAGYAGVDQLNEFNSEVIRNRQSSVIAPYLANSPTALMCPEDFRRDGARGTKKVAARGKSMNQAIGSKPFANPKSAVSGSWLPGEWKSDQREFRVFGTTGELTAGDPAGRWVIMDEAAFNLNDAAFAVMMKRGRWLDFPGRRHAQAASISFADGHVSLKKWQTIHTPNRYDETNVDWRWLSERTSEAIP